MKACIALAVVAAWVAANYGNPVPNTAKNWQAVSAKIREIQFVVFTNIQEIKQIAINDNRKVGRNISSQLDAASVRAAATILAPAAAEVRNQTLTQAKARDLVEQLKELISQLQDNLQEDLAQLSEGANHRISIMFLFSYIVAEKKAHQLYDLLAINWQAVSEKVTEMEALVRKTVLDIEAVAVDDSETVGRRISYKLYTASVNATSFLNQAVAAIGDQSLSEAQASQILQELQAILDKLHDNLLPDLVLLSERAKSEISALFDSSVKSAVKMGEELLVLLRQ